MYPFGTVNLIGFQDGLYQGLLVAKGAAATGLTISKGLAKVNGVAVERKASQEAADVVVAPTTPGTYNIYLNCAGALDANGVGLAQFSTTKEADKVRKAINGTDGITLGRSLVLATALVTGNTGTVTLGGTFVAADTVTVTLDGFNTVATLAAGDVTSATTVAAKVAAALNADALFITKATASAALGVVTITAITGTAYTLATSKVSTAGTSTASGAALAGGGIVDANVDNTARFKMAAAMISERIGF